jgi:hypothetical protein
MFLLLPFVYFVIIWYTFPCFGTFYQDKSGKPDGSYQSDFIKLIQGIICKKSGNLGARNFARYRRLHFSLYAGKPKMNGQL